LGPGGRFEILTSFDGFIRRRRRCRRVAVVFEDGDENLEALDDVVGVGDGQLLRREV
jgi:hypothetical protein